LCQHHQRHTEALRQLRHKIRERNFLEQMTHPRVFRAGQIKKQRQHCQHQRMPVLNRHRCQRPVMARAPGQTKGQQRLAIVLERRQPQVVGVFEHGQCFAAVQLHRELGRQLGKPRSTLQTREYLPGQRARIELHLRVDARSRAEHQVAHIITRCGRRP